MTCLAAVTDAELWHRVAESKDEDAYAELVKRGLAFASSQYQASAGRRKAAMDKRMAGR